jgi:hypothetical protein
MPCRASCGNTFSAFGLPGTWAKYRKCDIGSSAAWPHSASPAQKIDNAEGLTGYHRSNLQHYFDLGVFMVINPAEAAR